MMFIDFLLDVFERNQTRDAIIWRDNTYSYGWLVAAVRGWLDRLQAQAIAPGTVVALEADFSPNSVALMLAAVENRCIIVPLTKSVEAKKSEFRQIAQVEVIIELDQDDSVLVSKTSGCADHELLQNLRGLGHPGLVLFSSGSTGKSKAALHDFVPLLEKYMVPRHSQRTLTFLLFDHIGGMNTLLHTLSNAGCVITVKDRSPDAVCAAIEKHRVEVLPTSPTFINLLLMSGAYSRYDLSSLQLVTYGTEVMPESTLRRFRELFPNIRLLQTYGLSEVGILRSKSKSSDSLWVKIGGEGFETRVVDGMLEIKARSAMLGYLNAPSPFTEDGWLKTGDLVDVDGEYIRILGRKSEIINVGGEKVYPAEVEGVLQLMEGVEDVVVGAEPNPITGQMVVVRVKINTGESLSDFRKRMRAFCKDKLASYKIPQKVILVDKIMHGERFKKMRTISD
jgi:long-chain acyl-CoA synthetase